MDGAGPVVDVGRDGPSGADEDDLREALAELHGLLGPGPLDGLLDDLDGGGIGDRDADVVAALDLEDQHVRRAELVVGHQRPLEGPPLLGDPQPGALGGTYGAQGAGERFGIAHGREYRHLRYEFWAVTSA